MFALNPSICIVHFAKHILAISGPLFLLSSKPVSPAAFFIYSLRSPVKSESCSVLSDTLQPHGVLSPWNSPGTNTGVGSLSCLQGIFPTQGSNPGLPHFRQILYQLSHKGSQSILEWVAQPFSSDLPDPGIKLGSPALQADSLPTELRGKPHLALAQANHVDHILYKGDKQGQPGFMLRNKIGNIS